LRQELWLLVLRALEVLRDEDDDELVDRTLLELLVRFFPELLEELLELPVGHCLGSSTQFPHREPMIGMYLHGPRLRHSF
jgi:hypothetical protein